jgi:hypothetical protein
MACNSHYKQTFMKCRRKTVLHLLQRAVQSVEQYKVNAIESTI